MLHIRAFSKWLVYGRLIIANADCAHDSYKEDTIYLKLGKGPRAGIDDNDHCCWHFPAFFNFCRSFENAAFAFKLLPMANSYLIHLLFAHAACKELVHQKISPMVVILFIYEGQDYYFYITKRNSSVMVINRQTNF